MSNCIKKQNAYIQSTRAHSSLKQKLDQSQVNEAAKGQHSVQDTGSNTLFCTTCESRKYIFRHKFGLGITYIFLMRTFIYSALTVAVKELTQLLNRVL